MTCTVDGCTRDAYRSGICHAHRRRIQRTGDVKAGIPIGSVVAGGRPPHNPDGCHTCTEAPHLAGFGYSAFYVADRLGTSVEGLYKHVLRHPDLAARLTARFLDELRTTSQSARKTRQKETA